MLTIGAPAENPPSTCRLQHVLPVPPIVTNLPSRSKIAEFPMVWGLRNYATKPASPVPKTGRSGSVASFVEVPGPWVTAVACRSASTSVDAIDCRSQPDASPAMTTTSASLRNVNMVALLFFPLIRRQLLRRNRAGTRPVDVRGCLTRQSIRQAAVKNEKRRGAALGPSCFHAAALRSSLVPPHHAGLFRRIPLEHEVPRLEPRPPEREREHFAELLDEMHFERLAHLFRQVLEIALVLLRHDHRGDARAHGAEDFFLDSADREHAPTQRNLAGHGDVVPRGPTRQRRYQGRGHRHTGRRSILGNRTGGHVDVNVRIDERAFRNPQQIRV